MITGSRPFLGYGSGFKVAFWKDENCLFWLYVLVEADVLKALTVWLPLQSAAALIERPIDAYVASFDDPIEVADTARIPVLTAAFDKSPCDTPCATFENCVKTGHDLAA